MSVWAYGSRISSASRLQRGALRCIRGTRSRTDRITEFPRRCATRSSFGMMRVVPSGQGNRARKKAGLVRARLEVLASEADTITFQEGLLSFRATGGGGQCATQTLSVQLLW